MVQLEHRVNEEILTRFPAGAVQRVALLQETDDPQIGPDELLVRVFVGLAVVSEEAAAADSDSGQAAASSREESLQSWAAQHHLAMRRLRRELSWRLPPARLLEFTIDDSDTGSAPRIVMPHDPELASEPVPPREIVQTAIAILRSRYVFPDRAAEAAAEIEARLAAGEYDDLGEPELAERLTSQLYTVCADKHLRVRAHPERARSQPEPVDRNKSRQETRMIGRLDNFGIHRVQRLEGNVGYIDLHRVALPQNAGTSIAAAMELVSGTYALIIDLRQNGGGSPDGVVFWCSYLFDGPGTHFSDIFEGETGETRQFWSVSYVPGSRYVDKPVYLLTSHKTFSGGEDFCYTLQALGRAQLIGETTGGGAHPTGMRPLSPTMAISVPFARSVNPITGTNWEGTGVVPDIPVAAEEAYDVAYGMALRHVLSLDTPPPIRQEATAVLDRLDALSSLTLT
jgi:Peptidase family S41/N-terminal domain of Peptidase_S41 in eukaryotic IRBP